MPDSYSAPPAVIHTLDLEFCGLAGAIAAYLVVGPEGPVLVETGPGSTLACLRQRLQEAGYRPQEVRHVLVTHIHLDHAGAAGWWARQGARVYVHRVGAPHLVDPSRLLASAGRIYGDQMEQLWGEVLAAPAANVVPVADGQELRVGGLAFIALDTPGHAGHHHVYRLGKVAFTGDAAGIRLGDTDYLSVPTPPPEFDLARWLESVERLQGEAFVALYPTHFGRVEEPQRHLEVVRRLLVEGTQFVRQRLERGLGRQAIVEEYAAWNRERALASGMPAEELDRFEAVNPSYMSVDGIIRYWRKLAGE